MKRFFIFLFLVPGYFSVTYAQQGNAEAAVAKLNAEVRNQAYDPVLAHGILGFYLCDANTGAVIASHNPEMSMTPASTFKIVVSATALSLLGESYVFKTFVESDGLLQSNGTLKGNVYLRGGGDPTFGYGRIEGFPRFDSLFSLWADSVAKTGIKKIEGRIIGDASFFDDASLPETWTWNDMGNYYGAGPSGLSFNENQYTVYFKPSRYTGLVSDISRLFPEIEGMNFVNEIRTGPSGSSDNGYIYGAPFTSLRYLRGTIPARKEEFSIKGSLSEPALTAAQMLHRALKNRGIEITGEPTTVRLLKLTHSYTNPDRRIILTYPGPTLANVVYWLNKKSLNLYAENLLKLLGKEMLGEGTAENGFKVVREFWKSKGINLDGFSMWDGCGLSRYNMITPVQSAGMLRYMIKDKNFNAFWNSLPIAGVAEDPGTASSIGTGTKIAGNLRAKSGFIFGVRGYAGYVRDKSGDLLCFSLVANNFTCGPSEMRNRLEKIMVAIGELE